MCIEQHGSTWGIPLKSNARSHFEPTWPVMFFFEMWPMCKLAHVSTHELDEVSRCRITGIPLATATESLWAVGRTLGVWGCWGQGMARGRDPWMVSKVTTVNTSLIVETTLVGGLEHLFPYIGNNHPN